MRDWTIHLLYEFAKIRLDVSLRAKYGSAKVGIMAVARILVRERTPLGIGLVGGPEAAPTPRRREFAKNFKKYLKKIAKKRIILAYFQKNLTNNGLIFRAFGRKT